MKVIAKATMHIGKGTTGEREIFTKGKEYDYFPESSTDQDILVEPNDGMGHYAIFNQKDFIKCFTLIETTEAGQDEKK
jgi:hypothetical protein